MRIEVGSPVRLSPHDTLLVCSDGLVDNLRLSEIAELVRCGPLDHCMSRLTRAVTGRMGADGGEHPSKPDDLSVIGYRMKPGVRVSRRLPLPRQLELADPPA
jgi:serine/threonine protein phosphatase PrpC